MHDRVVAGLSVTPRVSDVCQTCAPTHARTHLSSKPQAGIVPDERGDEASLYHARTHARTNMPSLSQRVVPCVFGAQPWLEVCCGDGECGDDRGHSHHEAVHLRRRHSALSRRGFLGECTKWATTPLTGSLKKGGLGQSCTHAVRD